MSNYNETLQSNNSDLQSILNTINELPDATPEIVSAVTSVNGKTGDVQLSASDVGAVATDDLSIAVNEALAQAKASGEFDGNDGQRGTGLLPVTTAPSGYTTAVGDITPKYRMALSTIKTQSGATEVLLGDTVRYSYYHYPIAYLDASYAYFTTRVSIRGATGAAYTLTDTDKATIVTKVKAAMPTITMTGIDEDGVSHTWTLYGVSQA